MENIKDEKLLDILKGLGVCDFCSLDKSKFQDLLLSIDSELIKLRSLYAKLKKI